MARTKRKINPLAPVLEAQAADKGKAKYLTAVYVRLSVEDSGKKNTDTIEGQKKMLTDFISRQADMNLAGVWCDNGETGTNFARPQFEAMMEKVRAGEINCIAVKDLSRFGRNYKETGNYLERIFPFLGVRFIAVTDNFDTLTAERNENGYIVPLKNIINEAYSKDISKKSASALHSKQKRGDFIGSWAPYGYNKNPDDKHKLVINEETAPVVRQIFAWRAAGISVTQIARRLNDGGILSPSAYLYETGQVKTEKYHIILWTGRAVKNICTHPVYLGHMTQSRKRQSFYDGMSQVCLPENEWAVVCNTHEPIIDRQTFDAVQELTQKRREEYNSRLGKFDDMETCENIFRQLVFCTDCKRPLVRYKSVSHGKKLWYNFICPTHANDPKLCPKKSIREDKLTEIVAAAIQRQVALAVDMEAVIRDINNLPSFCREVEQSRSHIINAKRTLKRCQSLYDSLYQSYAEGLMSEDEYISLRERYKQQADEATQTISVLEQEMLCSKQYTPENLFLQAFTKFQSCTELTRDMLTALIERIYIDEHDGVEIIFKCRDEYNALCNFIEGRTGK
ncbi:MAG: recombinase family protein [Oscillospiraceae bacterium]|nr:recombinase family protein [Oscillospiraceae bacterium]